MTSLAESLGLIDPPSETEKTLDVNLEDITDAKSFALAVVESREFRSYIILGLQLGNLPGFTSILGKLLDHAWGKPPERVEHTGKDGAPIQTVTEVRRVIVRTPPDVGVEEDRPPAPAIH